MARKIRGMLSVTLAAAACAAVGGFGGPWNPLDLGPSGAVAAGVPRATEIIPQADADVERQGELATYAGDELFDYINGGAPQFLEYGFREVATQEFVCDGRTYIFDAYRMRDALAAYGIFSIRRPQGRERLAAFPHSACSSYQCLLAHGPYYIEVAAYESTPQTCNEIEHLAKLAVRNLEESLIITQPTAAPPFTLLPAMQRIGGTERLARGPISLRTALGRSGSGSFGKTVEALQSSLSGAAPQWVMADYHGLEDSTGTITAQTTLIILAKDGIPPADNLLATAADVRPAEEPVEQTENPEGWLVRPQEDPAWFVFVARDHLWLGTSQLPPDRLRTWIELLYKEE
ncbi:MAG: hypothetical protein KAY32_10705 [Candidatus Eisenbacteria sp.]|nr:hypothetical protein [Candidatus Eisenbacteria bacterium]